MRPGFEGGQNPLYMRLGKQRGPYSKDAMPVGPHRTSTQPVNLRDLETRFEEGAEVTLEALVDSGLVKHTRTDIKVLASGELTKKLTVTAHRFSAAAREKIEASGGTVIALREPVKKKRKKRRSAAPAPAAAAAAAEPEAAEAEEPAVEGEEEES
jgi:large subunit ribosomal protein L15